MLRTSHFTITSSNISSLADSSGLFLVGRCCSVHLVLGQPMFLLLLAVYYLLFLELNTTWRTPGIVRLCSHSLHCTVQITAQPGVDPLSQSF